MFSGRLFDETLHKNYIGSHTVICLYRNTVLNAGGGDMIHVIYIYMILILIPGPSKGDHGW